MDNKKPSFGMVEVSIQLDSDWWWRSSIKTIADGVFPLGSEYWYNCIFQPPWGLQGGPLPVIHGVIRCDVALRRSCHLKISTSNFPCWTKEADVKAWGGEFGEVGGRSGWQGRSVHWSFFGGFSMGKLCPWLSHWIWWFVGCFSFFL